jgi:uncharacterized protein YigE (DUF2233 family)
VKRLAAAAFALLAACGASADEEAEAAAEAAAAIVHPCRSDSFEGAALTHCVADPAQHTIAAVLGPKGGKPYRSLGNLAADKGEAASTVAFAMNGGMFDPQGEPIGYYVEDGKRLHKLNRATGPGNFHMLPNGVFFGSGGRWHVLTTDRFAKTVKDRPRFGTQSGPMLVIGGKLHPDIAKDGESRLIRNAVGVDAKGRAHFVIADSALSFGKLARYYRDQLKVPNALFLDGNVSALWDPVMGRIDASPPLGPLIVVEKRAKAAARKETP